MLQRVAGLRAHMERESLQADAELGRKPCQFQRAFRITAELARQVADSARAAKRHAQQQLGVGPVAPELAHFVGVVGDEGLHAGEQRVAEILVALDRVRVDAARGVNSQPRHQLHLAGSGQVEKSPQLGHRADHGRMRQRLQRVVKVDARQRARELAVLGADALAVDDEQRRTKGGHQPLHLGGCKRIDESALQGNTPVPSEE